MIRLNTTKPVVYVLSTDPAQDKEHQDFNWGKFLLTGDMKYVPAIAGEKLALFHLSRLGHRRYISMFGKSGNELEVCEEAVRYGLRRVEYYEVDGEPLVLSHKEEGNERRMTEESFGRLFEPSVILELGKRIIMLSDMSPLSVAG